MWHVAGRLAAPTPAQRGLLPAQRVCRVGDAGPAWRMRRAA